jgi:hypothetical protein
LEKFITLLRDYQRTSQVSALSSGQANAQSNVLDKEAAILVMQSKAMMDFDPTLTRQKSSVAIVAGGAGGFKQMK